MSVATTTGGGWPLWRRQVLAILTIEMRKMALSKRGFAAYLLGVLPWVILIIRAIAMMVFDGGDSEPPIAFAALFQVWMLHGAIYFACVAVFNHLFRGELADRSLHYYFLAPIRRTVLTVGKLVGGVAFTSLVFSISTVVSLVLMLIPHGWHVSSRYLFAGGGLGHLFVYLIVVVVACIGYGGLFLLSGVLLRNPIVPVIFIFLWEAVNPLLPVVLKKLSIIFYLTSLCPVPIPAETIAIIADPAPAWIAFLVPVAVAAVCVALASLRVQRMEIAYGTD